MCKKHREGFKLFRLYNAWIHNYYWHIRILIFWALLTPFNFYLRWNLPNSLHMYGEQSACYELSFHLVVHCLKIPHSFYGNNQIVLLWTMPFKKTLHELLNVILRTRRKYYIVIIKWLKYLMIKYLATI